MNKSQALTDFQLNCQKYYICYSLAAMGLKEFVDKFSKLHPNRANSLIVGAGHPDDGKWHGSINIGELLDASQPDGTFLDTIAKSFISTIYSSWDEYYRNSIADEAGVEQKKVISNLMGDLRHIRHCIVHKKSILSNEPEKLKEISWKLVAGPLCISDEMLQELMDQVNKMTVSIEGP